jgi:DNA modification methylase
MIKEIIICQRKAGDLALGFPNPRKITKEKLSDLGDSLNTLGDFGIIVIDENDQVVVGLQRVKILQEIDPERIIDCKQLLGYNEGEKKIINIRANQHSGKWDEKFLEQVLIELDRMDYNINLTGIDELEMEELGIDLDLDEDLNSDLEDVAPTIETEPTIKPGEVIELGRHKILCGDTTDRENLARLFEGNKCAMVFTDPPYNCDYTDVRGRKIKNDKFKGNGFFLFLTAYFEAIRDYVAGDVYACMSSNEAWTLRAAFEECGGKYSDFLIWVKNHFTLNRSNYQKQYEVILYGWFKDSSHYWNGRRNQCNVIRDNIRMEGEECYLRIKESEVETNIWEYPKPVLNKEHPTMKPVALAQRAIVNSSRLNDIVFDGFLGSGTTLIACEKTGRTCYGLELDPHYCEVIVKRWKEYRK